MHEIGIKNYDCPYEAKIMAKVNIYYFKVYKKMKVSSLCLLYFNSEPRFINLNVNCSP